MRRYFCQVMLQVHAGMLRVSEQKSVPSWSWTLVSRLDLGPDLDQLVLDLMPEAGELCTGKGTEGDEEGGDSGMEVAVRFAVAG